MSFSPRLLKTVATSAVVATLTAVASSLLTFHVLTPEDRSDYTGLKHHESFPILLSGALLGGTAGGIIAIWLFLKFDFEFVENEIIKKVNETTKSTNDKLDKCVTSLDTNLQDKITNRANELCNGINVSIQKINELQKSINELRENPENPSSTA